MFYNYFSRDVRFVGFFFSLFFFPSHNVCHKGSNMPFLAIHTVIVQCSIHTRSSPFHRSASLWAWLIWCMGRLCPWTTPDFFYVTHVASFQNSGFPVNCQTPQRLITYCLKLISTDCFTNCVTAYHVWRWDSRQWNDWLCKVLKSQREKFDLWSFFTAIYLQVFSLVCAENICWVCAPLHDGSS